MAPSFDDKMLEVVAVLGASQMGVSKVFGGMHHHRISQVSTIFIVLDITGIYNFNVSGLKI